MVLGGSDEGPLWAAYGRTVFVAKVDGQVLRIHIGLRTPALDEILMRRGLGTWAFITAWNPGSQELSRDANDARHRQLVDHVNRLGLPWFEGQGEPADSGWSPEESILLFGISAVDASRLGRSFGQNAIVVGNRGGEARLLRCLTAESDASHRGNDE
jgi:hypothetical protein